MDDLLPSYDSVTRRSPWELVAPYLTSDDLCATALVCQKWHEIFTPQLWGNPASHFGTQNDTVYVALTRFKRTLLWARPSVRELTHTLHLPPAHTEIYGGPHAEWLRDCLERLPRLQSLIVNGLPFFDHASLLTLRHPSIWWTSVRQNTFPVFDLRLLDASGCSNATSTGLAEALPHFPSLVSLDLSRTLAAKDEVVLSKLASLRNLRVLKLRGLGLKDLEFATVTRSISTRVRSLDVSGNLLTDASARYLLEHCIKATVVAPTSFVAPFEEPTLAGDLDIFGIEDLDLHLRRKLTQGFIGSLAIEQATDWGITHIYLSKNMITVEGVSGLLRSKRLQVLDAGTLPLVLQRPQHLSDDHEGLVVLPGVEKLTPILAECAAEKLGYLRLNHEIVTKDAPFEGSRSPRAEMEGDLPPTIIPGAHEVEAVGLPQSELDAVENQIHELPADTQPVELPATPSTQDVSSPEIKATLPGRSGSDGLLKPKKAPLIKITTESKQINRGPAFAPEPVETLLSPVSPVTEAQGDMTPMSPTSPTSTTIVSDTLFVHQPNDDLRRFTRSRHNSAHYVEDRRAILDLRYSQEHRLHPVTIPKAHTLVLTNVPLMTEDHEIVHRLIQFIKDCAEEAAIANLRARHTYKLPPGRSRKVAEKEYSRHLFALKRIVLEMAAPKVAPKKISSSWRQYPTKSSTEDTDSEAFWDAAIHDFSFFSDEECGLPNAEPGRHMPLAAMSGLILAPSTRAPDPKPRQAEGSVKKMYDVISEISQFRQEKKAAYLKTTQFGDVDPDVQGYWPGIISVIRKPEDSQSGSLDYYGNRYESGWLYR
ncbi:hypothetical protein B0J11DRAFT_287741 [Dendryphion nanum]|uniref:F-box domain-containing protein n=1 Tax=Dendryphion nanum TaxID=256645 RepID=A0A9P9DXK4_9PLEO|nr:hypothetical protein B0J11DRAFT_287741 [Dendryphion nanum]